MIGSYKKHQNLIKKFKLDAQKEIKGIRIFDRHVGKFILIRFIEDLSKNRCKLTDWTRYLIKINTKGMADCYAIIPTKFGLLHIEIEFKTGNATQTKEQKNWQNFIEKNNGIYLMIREEYFEQLMELKNRVTYAALNDSVDL